MEATSRRKFLTSVAAALIAGNSVPAARLSESPRKLQTVLGPVSLDDLGITLMHEHVLVDFIGADRVSKMRYNQDEVFRTVLPHLKRIRELGCKTLAECTPAYLGRDPLLLRRLSEASQVQLITNTGYYGAANNKYLPGHAFSESAEQLAARWIHEYEAGIDGTGIKPGFIKIGVNKGPLSDIDRKLVRAAARTHRATGLTIASHTGDGAAALEQIKILKEEGVRASAFIWVHAQNEPDPAIHARAADQEAWVEYEGFGAPSLNKQVERLRSLIDQGHAGRILVSLDAGWYHVGEPGGGQFRSYASFFADLLPALRKAGINEAQIRDLSLENPRNALHPKLRLL